MPACSLTERRQVQSLPDSVHRPITALLEARCPPEASLAATRDADTVVGLISRTKASGAGYVDRAADAGAKI